MSSDLPAAGTSPRRPSRQGSASRTTADAHSALAATRARHEIDQERQRARDLVRAGRAGDHLSFEWTFVQAGADFNPDAAPWTLWNGRVMYQTEAGTAIRYDEGCPELVHREQEFPPAIDAAGDVRLRRVTFTAAPIVSFPQRAAPAARSAISVASTTAPASNQTSLISTERAASRYYIPLVASACGIWPVHTQPPNSEWTSARNAIGTELFDAISQSLQAAHSQQENEAMARDLRSGGMYVGQNQQDLYVAPVTSGPVWGILQSRLTTLFSAGPATATEDLANRRRPREEDISSLTAQWAAPQFPPLQQQTPLAPHFPLVPAQPQMPMPMGPTYQNAQALDNAAFAQQWNNFGPDPTIQHQMGTERAQTQLERLKYTFLGEAIAIPGVIPTGMAVFYPAHWINLMFPPHLPPGAPPTPQLRQGAIDSWMMAQHTKIMSLSPTPLKIVRNMFDLTKDTFISYLKTLQRRPATSEEWMVSVLILRAFFLQCITVEYDLAAADAIYLKVCAKPAFPDYNVATQGAAKRKQN